MSRRTGRKIWKFLTLPAYKKRYLLEAFLYLGWARILKALPFSAVAPALGRRMTETAPDRDPARDRAIREVARAVWTAGRHTFWESSCLVRAIAAQKMLARRGIPSTLYLGTAKDESGRLIAHAWLRSGPYYVTGAEEMNRFTAVAAFGSDEPRGKREGA